LEYLLELFKINCVRLIVQNQQVEVAKLSEMIFSNQNAECLTTLTVFYRVYCALFYIENDSKIFTAHYTWNVAEKGFKMAFMMSKLAIINSCEIIL
jgi:hypothetical protein